jgi:Domain of unknown function DUF29
MAKAMARPTDPALYEGDFYVWTQRQAELLRARRFDELDLPHLIEEVKDLGTSQRKEVFSRSQQILRHLLKLHFSTAVEPRQGWRQTVRDQRDELELALTPSLPRDVEASLPTRFARSRRTALRDLADHGERADLPTACPYTLDQILDPDWYPPNVHGLVDLAPQEDDDG